ncbi:MAG: DegV family EDD domain-containing protein [Butyrivibrio sp.]|nr:DegV family EDD domain-containing protein [Butyrivibrio sp.]
MKYVTDSSCDTLTYAGEEVNVAPLRIYTSERDFLDTPELDVHEMLDYLLSYKDRSYTSCPSQDAWLKAYEGGDEIYVITLTSNLSGTYNSACAARDMYLQDNPNAKILVIDSLSTGPEMRLILEKIIEWKKEGKTFEDISADMPAYLSSTRLFFAFKSLHNFAQNGRVNKVLASMITKLNISILGTASPDGNIEPNIKCRGINNVISNLSAEMTKAGFKGGKLRICHIENEELATKIGNKMKELYPTTDICIYKAHGLCSYYGERGGVIIGCEC